MAGGPLYTRGGDIEVNHQEPYQQERLRAIAIIPVVRQGEVIACFNLASHTQDEIPLESRYALEAIAAQIGNAVTRLQAEESVRQGRAELETLFDSVQDFVLAPDCFPGYAYGHAAVETVRSRLDEIAVVLLDVTMPHLDGAETFRAFRQLSPACPSSGPADSARLT
jgi:GAF domain-containing protein